MPRVSLNVPAPDFTLPDFTGRPVSLSDFRGEQERAAGLQPRLHLTVLPQAYGAVAP